MRENDDLYFTLRDHLGRTSVIADASGGIMSEIRYDPFGGTRYTSNPLPTDYRYTGQREHAEIGLYFYNARWYDPSLGHFAQADTLIPELGNPMAWDRYAYTYNNPLYYTDPSGHVVCDPKQCGYTHDYDSEGEWSPLADLYIIRLKAEYGLAGGNEFANFEGTDFFAHPEYDPAEDEFLTSVGQAVAENGAYGNLWSLDVENLYRQYNFYKMATTGEGFLQFLAEGMGGIGEAGLASLPAIIRFRNDVKAAGYWYGGESGLSYHYTDHNFDEFGQPIWDSPEAYTQDAITFYNENRELAHPWKLNNQEMGIKIVYDNFYGIYTREGRIVSFGIR